MESQIAVTRYLGSLRRSVQHFSTGSLGCQARGGANHEARRRDHRAEGLDTEEQAREKRGHQQRRDDADGAATSRSWRRAARIRR